MAHFRPTGPLARWAAVTALAAAVAPAASAAEFQLTYTGIFDTTDALNLQGGPTTDFTSPTPFTATAVFDDASPNIAAPVGVPGFVAYSPLWATLTVAGQTYNVTTYNQDPTAGVTVAVFDDTTPFMPGHYATGFLQNPLADGAGFIGDWLTSTPTFSAGHLVPTTFTDYQGVGYGSGPTPMGSTTPLVVPIPLTTPGGGHYALTLGNYDEDYAPTGRLNTARLQSVPEPSSAGLLAAGLALVAVTRRRRARGR